MKPAYSKSTIIVDAALGLTRLGSPGCSDKSPSSTTVVSAPLPPPMQPLGISFAVHMQPAAMAMDVHHPLAMPHHMMVLQPQPHEAAVPAGARPPARPHMMLPLPAAAAGFDYPHRQILHPPHPANHFPDPAMAMDRYSNAGRMAAAGAVAQLVRAQPQAAPMPMPTSKNFPETLFDVICHQEYGHIIAWLPHGRGFMIHDKDRFAEMILPRHFEGAKFTSFTRRLKRWSFKRVPRGPELGAYYNKDFTRDDPGMVQKMIYQTDGLFEEGKKKIGGKNKKDGETEDESKNDMERAEGLPKRKKIQTSKSKSLVGDDQPLQPLLHVSSSKTQNLQADRANSSNLTSLEQKVRQQTKIVHTNLPAAALPLPSTLPKRSKGYKITPPTVHVTSQSASHETVAPRPATVTDPSLSQGMSPKLSTQNIPEERHSMEVNYQRELQARSMIALREAAAGRQVIPPASNIPRFRNNSAVMNSQPPRASDTTPRMNYIDREALIARTLEAERALLHSATRRAGHSGHPSAVSALSNQDLVASSMQRGGSAMDPAVADLQMRLAQPYENISKHHPRMSLESRSAILQREPQKLALPMSYDHHSEIPPRQLGANELGASHGAIAGGERAVMMSQEEEDEFARYLIAKRKGRFST